MRPAPAEGADVAPPPLGAAERWVAAAVVLAAVAPVWAGRWLPVLDLPQHLGLASIVSRLGDPATGFSRFYSVELRVTPYWGYLAPMRLLALVFPLELANKVLLSAYAAAVPLAAAALLRTLRRDPRWAVLSLPLVYNTNFFFGFEPFVVSIPVFLVALAVTDRLLAAERAESHRAAWAAALAAALFLCHVQTYLLYGLCWLVLLALHARRGRWWRRALAVAPSLVLFALWAGPAFLHGGGPRASAHTVHYRSYGGPGQLGAKWESAREVLARLPERTAGAFNDGSDQALLAAAAIALLVAVALARGGRGAEVGWRALARERRGELLAVVSLLAYLLLPMEIAGQWYLAPRYLVFAALLAPAFARGPARRPLVAAAAVVGLLACGNVALKVREFQRQVGPYAELAARLEPGRRLLGLPFDTGAAGPVRLWPFLHWAAYYQVRPGGDVGFSFAGLPSIPVVYRPGMQAPHPYEWRPDQFDWRSMGSHYDYFLVSGRPLGPGGRDLLEHARVVQVAGDWSLWVPRDGPAAGR